MSVVADAVAQAETQMALKRHEEAVHILDRALASDPDDFTLWSVKSRAHLGSGDTRLAVVAGRQALVGGSEEAFPNLVYAMALAMDGKGYEALEPALAVVRIAPDNAHGHMLVALSLSKRVEMRLPGFEQMERDVHAAAARAVELGAEDSTVRGNVGLAMYRMGKKTTARGHYQEAIRINPEDTWAMTRLAALEAERHRRVAGLRILRSVLALDPANFTVLRAAYGECRRFTARLIGMTAVFGLIAMLLIPAVRENAEANASLRMVVSAVFTVSIAIGLSFIWRVPSSVRRFMVNRRGGRLWAGTVVGAPLSVLAIAWTPVSFIVVPVAVFVLAVVAYMVLSAIVDRDAQARFTAGEWPEAAARARRQGLPEPSRNGGPAPVPPHRRVPAGIEQRFIAFILDGFFLGAFMVFFYFVGMLLMTFLIMGVLGLGESGSAFATGALIVLSIMFSAIFLYHWLWIASKGATPGKAILRIRVIDPATGLPPSSKASALRSGAHFLLGIIPLIGFLAEFALMSRDRPYFRGAKDDLAKTWVIRV